jgi:hypothetical protein
MNMFMYKSRFGRIILISMLCIIPQAQAHFGKGFVNGCLVSFASGTVGLKGFGFVLPSHKYTLGATGSLVGSVYAFASGITTCAKQGQFGYGLGQIFGSTMSAAVVTSLWFSGMVPNAAYLKQA